MNLQEMSDQFDVLFSNITSNQAPGLNEYEKSVFLTKAQNEIVKNYFSANSKGNTLGQGFDDSAKRQADFSGLMMTATCGQGRLGSGDTTFTFIYNKAGSGGSSSSSGSNEPSSGDSSEESVEVQYACTTIDPRSNLYAFPEDAFIIINETLTSGSGTTLKIYQVVPLRYDEYLRLMSKPYKRPVKHQAWRLLNAGIAEKNAAHAKVAEIITTPEADGSILTYRIRYIRKPLPIIVGALDGLTIEGKEYNNVKDIGCELDPILHEDILQRAVELAKAAWTGTGNDNTQMVMQVGQRSE